MTDSKSTDERRLILPDWPAPATVGALTTTRIGGCSRPPWQGFNLAMHVGDDPSAVSTNRRQLLALAGLRRDPLWLDQVHGTGVVDCAEAHDRVPEADASVCRLPGRACVIMTADCLPVLFCNLQGTEVAAAHAGWRGLASGVLRNTLAAMTSAPADLLVWLGPAIGPDRFEVGPEVQQMFLVNAVNERHRQRIPGNFRSAGTESDRQLADLYGLARAELLSLGVSHIYGGGDCTWSDPLRFFSYRRDGVTGRMASMVWLWQ